MNQLTNIMLFVTLLLSGFYGGIGFFVRMGGNPALLKMSDRGFAEYWQHVDSYMAVRMKIFGPALLLCMLCSVVLHIPNWNSPAFAVLLAAFLVLVIDLLFVFNVNHPLNKIIQSWDLRYLPGNVEEIKRKTIRAFNWRSAFMMLSFFLLLAALFLNGLDV